jgi:hypothetical protein
MSGGDDEDRGDRPRLSWSELDKRRDRPRTHTPERRPRGPAAEARARRAAQSYLHQADAKLFGRGTGGAGTAAKLAAVVREAQGTPELDAACRAYQETLGPPAADPALLGAFLDARDRAIRLAALDVLRDGLAEGRLALTGSLRSQLRMLADGSDDELAERAEELLARR